MLLFSAASCAQEDSLPREMLSEKKMVSVMVDVQLLEAMLPEKKASDDSLAVFIRTNYEHLFAKHGIQKEQFERTFAYYEQHPEKMDAMMTKVVDELSKAEAEVSDSTHR